MAGAFEYRPKFVDIRVKKTGAGAKPRAGRPAEAVEHPCDHVGCTRPGGHRAPKGRDHEGQFWSFCVEHAAEYNRRWNYFSGMSDAELAAYRAREEVGHRPTWTFRAGKGDRLSAAANAAGAKKYDPFGMFGGGDPAGARPAAAPKRRISRLQGMALEILLLDENASATDIRARYAELVKRWHPDSNGGDRAAEANLQRVLAAYQTLKAAGLV